MMSASKTFTLVLFCLAANCFGQNTNLPAYPVTTRSPREIPEVKSLAEWQARTKEIREQILVSSGLWPMPARKPVAAHISGKVERDGYSVEKVYFETWPGFFLAGNLYRPLVKGGGPFPGVLCPHGHWGDGRLSDTATNESVIGRCINFARQGMVAFAFDMVDCNDTRFADSPVNRKTFTTHIQFSTNATDQLWNISLFGVQTWNSLRALDFLASLPDVDTNRLAATGGSSGGAQTFMLGALDDRLAAQAPVCMVSHTMQGGCVCENAPGLRVEHINVEIAALPAPRPQIVVGATGDWTRATMEVEGPAMEKVYALFGATNKLRYVRFEARHNYNQASREVVYEWFGRWLLNETNSAALKEQPHESLDVSNLFVFADDKLPAGALTKAQFIESLKQRQRDQWQTLVPHDKKSFEKFKDVVLPMWEHTLLVNLTNDGKEIQSPVGRKVLFVKETSLESASQFTNFFTTYNRTAMQRAVRDLISKSEGSKVVCGSGRAGLQVLLAAPGLKASGIIADCNQLDATNDKNLLAPDLFCPGIRNIGTFQGAAMLAAPHPLLLHNIGTNFPTDAIRAAYKALGAEANLRIESQRLSDDELADWISKIR